MSNLTNETWTIKKITEYIDGSSNANKIIEIPKFQRGVVWGPSRIEMLVDSLFKSYPIGSLLAHQSGMVGNKIRYQMIDGLQRSSSLRRFALKPLVYATPEQLFSEEWLRHISNASGFSNVNDYEEVKKKVSGWMKSVETTESSEYLAHNLKRWLANEDLQVLTRLESHGAEIEAAIHKARTLIQDILGTPIPVMVYDGDEEFIPEIFERINAQGAPLSKYDILASSWIGVRTRISNEEISIAIQEKYKGWEADGFEVSDDLVSHEPGDGNLYEYLMGLSKVLARKFPALFGAKMDSEDIAFQIFTVACKLPVGKMRSLPQRLQEEPGGIIHPEALEKAILAACTEISDSVIGYTGLRGNKLSDELQTPHSQNQIISAICSLVVSCYDLATGELQDGKAREEILENFPAHYLMDIMKKNWKGSGDSKLFDRTWMKDRTGNDLVPDHFYRHEITRDMFMYEFRAWNTELMMKRQTTRPNLQKDVLVALQFLYTGIVSHLANKSTQFEIEHVFPVKFCADRIATNNDDGWPISAIGNLMFLEKTVNRIKGEKLLGTEVPKLYASGDILADERRLIGQYLVSPEVSQIVEESVTTAESYHEFCNMRAEEIGEKISTNLRLSGSR